MNAFSRTLPATVDTQERWAALLAQLQVAVSATPRAELERWLLDALAHTGKAGVRRVRNLGQLVHDIARRMFDETAQAVDAYKNDGLVESLNEQGRRFADDAAKLAHRVSVQVGGLVSMASNPARLPEAVVLVLAAFLTSGGVDADGGVPDLDLTLGIGAHRSIFTHSIISGTLVEGALFAACTLVGMVHRQLPALHDPLFDMVEANRNRYLQLATTGASLGIAYHLGIDASI